MDMLHLLGYGRKLFHFKNMKAPGVAPKIQSLQYLFFIRECHHSQTTQQPSSPLIQFLQASLGFSPKGALKVSKQLKKTIKNPYLIPSFLKSHGFSESHIKSIIQGCPALLYSSESRLAPKIQFFKEKGFSDSVVMELMVSNSGLFRRSLERFIKPVFHLIHSVVGRNEFVVECLKRQWIMYNTDTWSSNMTILRSCGIKDDHISRMIRKYPETFAVKPDRFNEVVEMVKGMGFNPLLASFMEAVYTMMCMSRLSWDMKLEVLKRVGWSDEDIQLAFRKKPNFMNLSEEKIKRGMGYFRKELDWDLSYISRDPRPLCFSLEKRVIPRHRFLQFLASKGCIKKDKFSLYQFSMSERRFLNECVMRYQSQVPNVLQIYQDLVGSKKINTRDMRHQSVAPIVAS